MFSATPPTHFSLTFDSLEHDLQVLSFTGEESISKPFAFELELVSERSDLDLEGLLHQQAFLAFDESGAGIHGQVYRVAQGDSGKRLTRYSLTLVPQLTCLGHRTNQRIFQNLDVPTIIQRVLEEHGLLANACRFHLGTVYPPRDYCVQYDESDLHFIQRLCWEEGLHYHFQHSRQGHVLVFGDDQTVFPRLGRPTAYVQDSGLVADEPVIRCFNLRLEARTSRVTRRDYNFEKASFTLESGYRPRSDQDQPDLEDYDYPAGFINGERGKLLSRRALERHRADYRLAEGHSDQPRLVAGHYLELSDHPRKEWNDLWLLTEVRHQGLQPGGLEEEASSDLNPHQDGFQQGYRNTFTATPGEVFYRSRQAYPKPRVLGSQTAVVTGPEGEEIHCDAFGRVKVQFHWDREGQGDEHSSGWLRVASSWAGNRHGAVTIPRVGMEVLVTFLEGDPDQPLVSGCLANSLTAPPYELPAHKTPAIEYPVLESLAKLTPAAPHVRLLDDTPEHELAEQGPVLVRVDWRCAEQVDWLAALLQAVLHDFRVLGLFSHWPFDDLSEHLRRTTQATWNKGANGGLLRYYDIRLFRTFCEQLDPPQLRHFHAPVIQWHWIDHDHKHREMFGRNDRCDDLHKRSSGMHLTDEQVMHLQARSAAVQWLTTQDAPLQQYWLDSRETLLRLLVEAYLELARQGRGKEHHAESVAEHLAKRVSSAATEYKVVL